ncbi:MAG: helix-turn-helix domain-containing protein [Myxococcales bacterium]
MSILDEKALLHVITDAVRQVVREELSKVPERSEYLSVREAAEIADVIPGTIRSWIETGKLGRYQAGRHVRVKRSDLDALLRQPTVTDREVSPEEQAFAAFRRRSGRVGMPE